jgi:hypothetical protein
VTYFDSPTAMDDFRAICHPNEAANLTYHLDFTSISPCPPHHIEDCDGTCHPSTINISSTLFKKIDVCGVCGGGATNISTCCPTGTTWNSSTLTCELPKYTVTYNANGATGGTVPIDTESPYTTGSTVTVRGNT